MVETYDYKYGTHNLNKTDIKVVDFTLDFMLKCQILKNRIRWIALACFLQPDPAISCHEFKGFIKYLKKNLHNSQFLKFVKNFGIQRVFYFVVANISEKIFQEENINKTTKNPGNKNNHIFVIQV